MSYRDVEVMTNQGVPEADARKIQELTDDFLAEVYGFGLNEFHVIRSLRAAYDLGRASVEGNQ
jgi:hypothetical protein